MSGIVKQLGNVNLIERSTIQLGMLVSNVNQPTESFKDLILHNDENVNIAVGTKLSYDGHTQKNYRTRTPCPYLWISYFSSSSAKLKVEASEYLTYSLHNAETLLREAVECATSDLKNWVHKGKVYMIVGLYTLRGKIFVEEWFEKKRARGGGVDIFRSITHFSGFRFQNLRTSQPGISYNDKSTENGQCRMEAEGERVWAILYRQVESKWRLTTITLRPWGWWSTTITLRPCKWWSLFSGRFVKDGNIFTV